ncbi:MAG: hypothetical protein Q9224_003846, partial [Gallowayella concinna]
VVEKGAEEVVRDDEEERVFVRMEVRIWWVAAWKGFLGGLLGWVLVEGVSSSSEDEESLVVSRARAESRWKEVDVVVVREARREFMVFVGLRAAKRRSSGEMESTSVVRRWD